MDTYLAVFGLALLDSVNPSALVITLYLLSQSTAPARVMSYISAIFVTYLAVGVLLLLGLDAFLASFEDVLSSPGAYAVQGVVGAAMLVYSFVPSSEGKEAKRFKKPSATSFAGLFLLGASVTLLELPTAFPYLGATAILSNAGLEPSQWLPVLVIYNLIFVLTPTLLVLGHALLGERLGTRYAALRERLQREARETMLWIVGIIGFFLLADSLRYFEFFGLT